MSDKRTRLFSADFDDEFAVGVEAGNAAVFGRNVLRGLIAGIDDFKATRQQRWSRRRSYGPGLLACTPWLDDDELLSKLSELSGACVVLTKQGRSKGDLPKLERLKRANKATAGLPIRAFPDLASWAPKVHGRPLVVGPYGPPMDEAVIPAIRTIGYRKSGRGDLPPIVHAKLALLGHLWWDDVGPHGHIEDVIGFTGQRLWISSANFTASSRRSLEFGYWTEDKALQAGAERFLLRLIRASEDVDPNADLIDPDLAPIEFDDAAFADYVTEMPWEDEEDWADEE